MCLRVLTGAAVGLALQMLAEAGANDLGRARPVDEVTASCLEGQHFHLRPAGRAEEHNRQVQVLAHLPQGKTGGETLLWRQPRGEEDQINGLVGDEVHRLSGGGERMDVTQAVQDRSEVGEHVWRGGKE